MDQKSFQSTENKRKHPSSDELATTRTLLAHERTLMAWVRTAFSMITFGFAIMKFFQYLAESGTLGSAQRGTGARNLGVTLVLLGTVSLVGATWQHWVSVKELHAAEQTSPWSLVMVVAILVTVIGLLAVVGAFVRTGIF